MLTVQEQIVEEIATLSEVELIAVVEYIEFLKSRPVAYQPNMTYEEMKTLYAEFGEEDRAMAEEGMSEYLKGIELEEKE